MSDLPHLSTSTPASEISSSDFAAMEARNDMVNSDEQAIPSMADILRNSPAAKLLGLPESLPEDTDENAAPEKLDEETDPKETSEDAVSDADEEQNQETTEEDKTDEDDQESTQQAELPVEEDIDWTYMVPVKIDGKVKHVSLEEIRKGYATDQHLSQKGREIGEQKKQIEIERTQKLNEVVTIGTVLHQELMAVENTIAAEYNAVEAKIKEARDGGDTYTARDLKDKRDELQEKYWAARNKREDAVTGIVKQIEIKKAEDTAALVEQFQKDITVLLPEFDTKLGKKIREFALGEGIPGELLETVYDARVVKVLNDYRKLKMAKETGVVKRKTVPVAKSVPSKKGPTQAAKQKRSDESLRTKVLTGAGDKRDQNEFLKSISTISRKL